MKSIEETLELILQSQNGIKQEIKDTRKELHEEIQGVKTE